MKKGHIKFILAAAMAFLLAGCNSNTNETPNPAEETKLPEVEATQQAAAMETPEIQETPMVSVEPEAGYETVQETVYTTDIVNVRSENSTDTRDNIVITLAKGKELYRVGVNDLWSRILYNGKVCYVATEYLTTEKPAKVNRIVAIDPGHQEQPNTDQEPVGPGAEETKDKAAPGTKGTASGLTEYELNLQVSLKLKEELIDRGYQVVMTREKNDINISNVERAKTANESGADIFIRIHANGSKNTNTTGIMMVSPTKDNPYVGTIYNECRKLSDSVLWHMVETTKAKDKGVWETDTMSGINWSKIPVTIVEMGFMSNEEEDKKMATEEYQKQLAKGIADGIDSYFEQ